MSKFLQAADPIYKNPIWAFPITATDRISLTANEAKLYTIPTNSEIILISSPKEVYVLFGDETVVSDIPDEYDPDILNGSSPMYCPGMICGVSFTGYTHLSVISEISTIVYIQRWSRR